MNELPSAAPAATVTAWLADTAARCAERVAVSDDRGAATYRELLTRAATCAARMRALGAAPGERVLIAVPNSVEYVVSLVATLWAGAVAVPLHAQSSRREVERIAADCTPRVAVATGALADWLRESAPESCSVVAPDTSDVPVALAAEHRAPYPAQARDLALILYTSGTTGRPKGVMLSHGNLTANFAAIIAALSLTEADSTLQVLPACYAYGNSVLWTHLLCGARVALARDFVFWPRLLDALQAQSVTGFYGVPATYSVLLSHSDFLRRAWQHLRYLACAGGALPASTVQRLADALPDTALYLMYGQTEAVARLSVLPPKETLVRPRSIGRGLSGVELSVVDDDGRRVEPGVVGQLVARGPNVMQGYWNDPQETSRALRDGMLWTGDLATVDDQGFIYVAGRHSELIKFGSHRIHPLEIEDVLHEHPAVAEAAVAAVPDDTWGEAPLACVTLAPGAAPPDDWTTFLAERLPRHKLPRQVLVVDVLPKTPAGKIDRAALKAQLSAGPRSTAVAAAMDSRTAS